MCRKALRYERSAMLDINATYHPFSDGLDECAFAPKRRGRG